METIGRRLQRLRGERRISVKSIADRLGVSPSTYREWEYGRAIQGEPYPALAEILGVTLSELITGKKPEKGQWQRELNRLEEQLQRLKKELLSIF